MNRRQFIRAAAVAPFALRSGAALAVPRPRALVTCDAESRLALVDLGSLEVVGTIATPSDPRAIEEVGGRGVVCHTAASAVSIVDRRRVLRVVHGFVEPRYAAAHPDGVHAFVTDSGDALLATVDITSGTVVGRLKLDEWPRHITIDRSGRTLWVGLGSAAQRVALVDVADPRRPRLLAHVATPFLSHDVGFAPDGRVWVTSGAHRTSAIFAPSGEASAPRPAGAAPQHVTFDRGRAYVTSGDDGTLTTHALDGRALSQVAVPTGSYNVQYGRGLVITPSLERGTLAVFAPGARKADVVKVAGSCHDACLIS